MRLLVALLSVAIAACSQAPVLKLPDVPVAAEFKERGTAAKPTGELPRESWCSGRPWAQPRGLHPWP